MVWLRWREPTRVYFTCPGQCGVMSNISEACATDQRQIAGVSKVKSGALLDSTEERRRTPASGFAPQELLRPVAEHGSPLTYDTLRERLYTLPKDSSRATAAEILSFVQSLGQPDNVTRVLQHIVDKEPLAQTVAGRSYRHTNHFDKIVLMDSGDRLGYRLTMHLWNPPYSEVEICDEQIHDHRFSFWSTVVVGTISFQNYIRDATGVIFDEYQYIPEKLNLATTGNFYVDVGQSPLLELQQSRATAGECYYLPFSQIHRVILPQASMTCTLVLRGPRQKNYASVFSNSRKYDPSGNVMFSSSSLSQKLALVLQELKKRCA
jgi:hypothetical protein